MDAPSGSVSAVVVIENQLPDTAFLDGLERQLESHFLDFEFIFVANGGAPAVRELKRQIAQIPDATCLVLTERHDVDAARLIGMEHAIGDHVLVLSPGPQVLDTLPTVLEQMRAGYDVVFAAPTTSLRTPLIERAAYALLSRLSGISLSSDTVILALLNREAALHLLDKINAEILLKARALGPGFSTTTVKITPLGSPTVSRSLSARAAKAIRLLVSTGATPIRFMGAVSIAASGLSLLYAAYVVLVFLFKPDVEAGWTTLSLQVAGMMFLFSTMFWLLSEYVVQIHGALASRRRRVVVRELRSERRRVARLNVVDESGAYRLAGSDPIGG
jgi:hypothetical protein